jgi:hypothetical protein
LLLPAPLGEHDVVDVPEEVLLLQFFEEYLVGSDGVRAQVVIFYPRFFLEAPLSQDLLELSTLGGILSWLLCKLACYLFELRPIQMLFQSLCQVILLLT